LVAIEEEAEASVEEAVIAEVAEVDQEVVVVIEEEAAEAVAEVASVLAPRSSFNPMRDSRAFTF
jgi:hypothetical protein